MHKGCALGVSDSAQESQRFDLVPNTVQLLSLGLDYWHVLRPHGEMPLLRLPVLPREAGNSRENLLVKAEEASEQVTLACARYNHA
jgi:hypothetical protein